MLNSMKSWFINKFKPPLRRLYVRLILIINTTTPQTVKHYIEQTPFMKVVDMHRHFYYGLDYDERHTITMILEWSIHYTMAYTYRFFMYITTPFRFIINLVKHNEFLNFFVSFVMFAVSMAYLALFFATITTKDYLKAFMIENNLFLGALVLFIFGIVWLIFRHGAMHKFNLYLSEYKNKDLFIGLIIWSALLKFVLSILYENIATTALHPISVMAWLFFPVFVLFAFMFIITVMFWIIHYSNRYINTKGMTRYEKLIYQGRKYSNLRIFGLYILWTIMSFFFVWVSHKFFYTYIALDDITPINVFLIYFSSFFLLIFLLPRWLKILFEISKQAQHSYNNKALKNLFFFGVITYLFSFYAHKFYYTSFSAYAFNFSFLTFSIFVLLVLTLVALSFLNKHFIKTARAITFFSTALVYFLSLFYWINFDRSTPKFQFVIDMATQSLLGIDVIFGIDGISLFFVLLTTLISPLLVLITWTVEKDVKLLSVIIVITELLTLLTFMALDLFLFYIAFEAILIPLFISILIWGSRRRKIKAGKMLFVYTLMSSILFLIALFTFYTELGSTNFFALSTYTTVALSAEKQNFLWMLLFIAFGIKVPLYPLHTWLPEAHVEAPTFGSVILASLLLKTGGYGIFRFILPLFPQANIYFSPLVFMLALMGVIYAALASIRQIDMKRIIAYLSVSHMNLCVLGQFSESLEGLIGSLLLMAAHGLIAAGFFISVGVVYERYHTRLIYYYGGLARVMPVFATMLFIFVLGNMNMPGTSNFVGELLILISIGYKGFVLCLLAAIGSAIGALCTIWFWNRLMFGELKLQYFGKFQDINRREVAIVAPLIVFNFAIGIFTNEFIDTCYASIYFLYSFLLI